MSRHYLRIIFFNCMPTPVTSVRTMSKPVAISASNRLLPWAGIAITCRWRND